MIGTKREQLYAAVGGIGDDLITRARDDDRLRRMNQRRRTRRAVRAVWISVAACLLLTFIGGLWVQIDMNRFMASCGGRSGTLVHGTYYFYDPNSGFYAYTPGGEPIRLVSELFHDLEGVRVNGYGVYYTEKSRRNLVVRVHETGKTVTLYRADSDEYTHTAIHEIYEESILFMLYNKELSYRTLLLIDGRTGEVLETLFEKQPYDAYCADIPYPVGERRVALRSDPAHPLRHLVENGEPILADGHYLFIGDEYNHNRYAGDSLIAGFYRDRDDDPTLSNRSFVLIRPNGENILIPNGFSVIGGTDDYLFGRPADADLRTLWSYHIETGAVTLLIPEYTMQEITTDGVHLYATAPWSAHADVYRLNYAEDGTLTGLSLIDIVGE